MKELDFLKIINNSLDNPEYLGDDCAYLDEAGLFVTHDTLVEDVHFSLYTTNAYLLGRKSISVNLSDLAAALAKPLYVSISLSLPKNTDNKFIEELYRGINDICRENNVKVIGGDITGSDKIVISVCAIGKKISKYLTSRNNAKKGDYIVVTGEFGSSGAGLYALSNFLYSEEDLINKHLNPVARVKEALDLAKIINKDITATDASDGLVDSLYKIALASRHSIKININDVPVSKSLCEFSRRNKLDYKHFVKWGAEDYELVLCVPKEIFCKLDKTVFIPIGHVLNKDSNPVVYIQNENNTEKVDDKSFQNNSYNHF